MGEKLLSQRHPVFYFVSVWEKRIKRYMEWTFGRKRYVKYRSGENLPFRIKSHQSVLIRKLGDSDIKLQYNKVENLRIAAGKINGAIIKPGETFSFCRLVGRPTRRKGYLPGLELSFGESGQGVGGGLCQIANLIHWLVLHSPLTVTERHHHSFDPFPDNGRVQPFGSGATVFYNYIDYQFANNTSLTFQLNLWLSEKYLEGEMRVNNALDYTYHVYEKEHEFLKVGDNYYRKNEIWRDKVSKGREKLIGTELLAKNFALVKYVPVDYRIADEPDEQK